MASSEELLKNDTGDLWDSGKVESDQSVHVDYVGMSVATVEEKSEFKRLNKIARRGVEAFMECGNALIAIQDKQL